MDLATIPMEELAPLLQMQLDHGGRANLVVTGNSMYPMLLHRRDRVSLVIPVAPLRRGDLILYRRENGQHVLHRIITKPKEDAFFCSGDNQWIRESVKASQVIALVDGFTRKGKNRSISGLSHRLYVSLWVWLFPVRKPLICLRRSIGRLRASLRK